MARRKSNSGAKTSQPTRGKAPGKRQVTPATKKDGKSTAVKAPPDASSVEGTTPDLQPQILLTHDQIAARAYALWEAKGKPDGQEQTIWQEAQHGLWQEARG